ncbi:MAG: recombinase family protein, partial [Candidatus Saccharibacteria bacterium]|nr:recombinase family protein [Candidatus Saccharibacteria bacterium]
KEGQVQKGSLLLVENLDRLSRAKVMDALEVFTSIINGGITIVTLMDGMHYSKESLNANLLPLMTTIMSFAMAYEESAKKGVRVKASWKAKQKAAIAGGSIMTKRTPKWIETNAERTKFSLNEERTTVVNQIIALAEKGTGNNSICRHLNNKGVPSWNVSGKWQHSYIQKVLQNHALYGGIEIDGTVKENYYPAVITHEKWLLLQATRSSRRTTLATNRKGNTVTNLFSGLLKCGYCGGPMNVAGYKSRVNGYDRKYYGCQSARTGAAKCKMKTWFIDELEPALLFWLTKVDYGTLMGQTSQEAVNIEREKLAAINQQIEVTNNKRSNVVGAIEEGAKGLVSRINELDENLTELAAAAKAQKQAVNLVAARNQNGAGRMKALVNLFKALKTTTDVAELRTLREQLSASIHAVTERITLYPTGHSLDGNRANRFIDIEFRGGSVRRIESEEC